MRGTVAWLFITTFYFLVFPLGAAQGQSSQDFLSSRLEPGTYTIKFESAGFRTEARSGLVLRDCNQRPQSYSLPCRGMLVSVLAKRNTPVD